MTEARDLSIVYSEPPEQVFVNAASAFGITVDQARRAYGQMICDAQPTIVDGKEPHPLALNDRALKTMLAVEGRSDDSGINTRWFGIRYEQGERPPIKGGFISDKRSRA